MNNASKKLEILANTLIVILALLLGGTLVSRYWLPGKPIQPATENTVKNGTKLPISEMSWAAGNKNVVLAISTSCHFCVESTPFYQRLAQQRAGRDDVKIIAVTPQPVDEARRYLADKGIAVDEVRQVKLSEINVAGTPTLIVVDQTGTVVESWVGRLQPEKESDVLSHVFGERASL